MLLDLVYRNLSTQIIILHIEIYMCMIGKSDEKVFKNNIDNYFNFKANNYIDNVFVEENEVSIKYKDTIERYGFVLVKKYYCLQYMHGTIEFYNHMSEYKNVKLKNIINTIMYFDDKQYIFVTRFDTNPKKLLIE